MKIGCVVLAAGNARRFGSNKLQVQVDGESLIRRALETVPSGLVTVVVSQYPEILSLAGEYGFGAVLNDQPDLGLSRSVRLGLEQLTDCGGVLFLVADQPWLKRDSVEALAALWAQHPAKIAAMAHGGIRGNPCLFPARFYPELLALNGDRGGSAVIRRHEEDLLLLETDALELTDVDPDPQESYLAYWVVRSGDDPVATMQIPGPITSSEEEARLFEGWFLEDGTRLEDSPYYMGPGADHVGNLDRDVTFYGHWRTAESGEGSPDGGDGFGTLLVGVAVVDVAGVVAYQVGTELILDQLLPAGVAVSHTRAELAMFLWNTAGRPAPATLPAFADVADPELAQAAQWAIEQGYLKARADGSFKPDKGVAKWRVIRGYRAVTEP